jgi:hypothetical protein
VCERETERVKGTDMKEREDESDCDCVHKATSAPSL